MFGFKPWEILERKLKKSPSLTDGVIIEIHCDTPEKMQQRLQEYSQAFGGEEKVPEKLKAPETVVDIEFTTLSGKRQQLHCGGSKGEMLSKLGVGSRVRVAYAEHKDQVLARIAEKDMS